MTPIASKKKSLALVDAEEKADVVLTIDDRALTVPKIVFGIGARPPRTARAASSTAAGECCESWTGRDQTVTCGPIGAAYVRAADQRVNPHVDVGHQSRWLG